MIMYRNKSRRWKGIQVEENTISLSERRLSSAFPFQDCNIQKREASRWMRIVMAHFAKSLHAIMTFGVMF